MQLSDYPFACLPQKEDWVQLAKTCDGYYVCQKDMRQNRLTPLVGYAGRYGEEGKQYVGEVYIDFSKIERHGRALKEVATHLATRTDEISKGNISRTTGFCGLPEGGRDLATALSLLCQNEHIFPEKKIVALETETSRQKSKLVFGRHRPKKGETWWLVEDICNNFSTTEDACNLIMEAGAEVAGILCFLHRTPAAGNSYRLGDRELPVISLWREPIPEYEQDDPYVADDIPGNVVWKPKDVWDDGWRDPK